MLHHPWGHCFLEDLPVSTFAFLSIDLQTSEMTKDSTLNPRP